MLVNRLKVEQYVRNKPSIECTGSLKRLASQARQNRGVEGVDRPPFSWPTPPLISVFRAKNFPGGACPQTPLVRLRAAGARARLPHILV